MQVPDTVRVDQEPKGQLLRQRLPQQTGARGGEKAARVSGEHK